jgi:hypothetical protein
MLAVTPAKMLPHTKSTNAINASAKQQLRIPNFRIPPPYVPSVLPDRFAVPRSFIATASSVQRNQPGEKRFRF